MKSKCVDISAGVEPLIKSREAAKELGVTTGTLRQWRYNRKGPPHYKLGGIRYRKSDIAAFIEACRVDPVAS